MAERYYFDTCMWGDFYEDRFGIKGRPLGKYASQLFIHLIKNKDILYFSDLIIRELKTEYDENEINDMLNVLFISKILKKVEMTEEDYKKSRLIAAERNLPVSDALHAILARNNNATLISQDNHLQELKDIVKVKKPEEII